MAMQTFSYIYVPFIHEVFQTEFAAELREQWTVVFGAQFEDLARRFAQNMVFGRPTTAYFNATRQMAYLNTNPALLEELDMMIQNGHAQLQPMAAPAQAEAPAGNRPSTLEYNRKLLLIARGGGQAGRRQNRIAVKSHVITAGTLVGRLIGYLMVEGSFFAVIVMMTNQIFVKFAVHPFPTTRPTAIIVLHATKTCVTQDALVDVVRTAPTLFAQLVLRPRRCAVSVIQIPRRRRQRAMALQRRTHPPIQSRSLSKFARSRSTSRRVTEPMRTRHISACVYNGGVK
jgi:hypothetical protein